MRPHGEKTLVSLLCWKLRALNGLQTGTFNLSTLTVDSGGNGLAHNFPHGYPLSFSKEDSPISALPTGGEIQKRPRFAFPQPLNPGQPGWRPREGPGLPSPGASMPLKPGQPGSRSREGPRLPSPGASMLFFLKVTFAYQSLSKFQVTELN